MNEWRLRDVQLGMMMIGNHQKGDVHHHDDDERHSDFRIFRKTKTEKKTKGENSIRKLGVIRTQVTNKK